MKILVLGKEGQVARALQAASASPQSDVEVISIGRPHCDVAQPATISAVLERTSPDLVVNAAAYTAVDKAEAEPAMAQAINAHGAGYAAQACARRALPFIHISTDYVFDGRKATPYTEDDEVGPLGAYGRSKLDGERQVAAALREHIVLRTAWVVSPYGNNFVKTMLRLGQTRSEIGVVNDQFGNATFAPHLAQIIMSLARRVATTPREVMPWGIYHAAGSGEGTWYDVACEVFRLSAERGGRAVNVRPITTAEYPTPARRPQNSRLDCGRLARAFGLSLPDWRLGIAECVAQLDAAAM
jgi:dTDP-4-dehydrorhamnose reductase